MTFRDAWNTQVPIRAFRLAAVLVAVTILNLGAIFGVWRSFEKIEAAELRDDIATCEQRAATRDDLRGVLLALFNLIDDNGDGSLAFVIEARRILDDGYPALDIADCSMEE